MFDFTIPPETKALRVRIAAFGRDEVIPQERFAGGHEGLAPERLAELRARARELGIPSEGHRTAIARDVLKEVAERARQATAEDADERGETRHRGNEGNGGQSGVAEVAESTKEGERR